MIHKEDDTWVTKFNEETFSRADVRSLMDLARRPLLRTVSDLEAENANLREQVSRLLEEKARFESIINEYREFIRCHD